MYNAKLVVLISKCKCKSIIYKKAQLSKGDGSMDDVFPSKPIKLSVI